MPLCAPCVLGAAHPLVFECAACAQPQRIAHPLWRTQRTELAFSTATWACNNPGCPGAAAMPGQCWRVRDEEQLVQIPARGSTRSDNKVGTSRFLFWGEWCVSHVGVGEREV